MTQKNTRFLRIIIYKSERMNFQIHSKNRHLRKSVFFQRYLCSILCFYIAIYFSLSSYKESSKTFLCTFEFLTVNTCIYYKYA